VLQILYFSVSTKEAPSLMTSMRKLDQDPSDSTGVSTTTSTPLDYLISFPTDGVKKVLLYLVEQ
jgi:hypothetical protein